MELADVPDSKSGGSDTVWVQVPPPAPNATQIEPQGLICVVFLCKKAEDQLRSVKKSVLLAESKKENGNMTAVFLFWVIFPLFRPFHWSSAQAPCGIRLLRRDRRG